jgi:hypothetical protein
MSKHAYRYIQEQETCAVCNYEGPASWIGTKPLLFCSPACHSEYTGVEINPYDCYEYRNEGEF